MVIINLPPTLSMKRKAVLIASPLPKLFSCLKNGEKVRNLAFRALPNQLGLITKTNRKEIVLRAAIDAAFEEIKGKRI